MVLEIPDLAGGAAPARTKGSGTPGQGNNGGQAIFSGNVTAGGGGGSGGNGSSNTYGGTANTYPIYPAPIIAPAIPSTDRPDWTPTVTTAGYYASGGNGGSNSSNLTSLGGAGGNSAFLNVSYRHAHNYTGAGGGGILEDLVMLVVMVGMGLMGLLLFGLMFHNMFSFIKINT